MLLDLGFVTLHRPEFARSISGLLDSIRNELIVCVWVASGLVLFSFVWFRLVWFGFAWLGLACLGWCNQVKQCHLKEVEASPIDFDFN